MTLDQTERAPSLSLYCEIWGTPAPGSTIVLLHELGGTLESLRSFADLLAARYAVVLFDQRAAGRSEKPAAPFTMTDLADDVRRVMEALGLPRPFTLMGVAMGALTALHFAVRHSDRLDALILCDGTAEINKAASDYLLNRADAVRKDGMRAVVETTLKNSFRGIAESDPGRIDYRHRFLGNSPEGYAMQSAALASVSLGDDDFAKVHCRTLVLTGENDFIWPPAAGSALAGKLPNARFEVVKNTAHLPPIQDATSVASRVTAFLDEDTHSFKAAARK